MSLNKGSLVITAGAFAIFSDICAHDLINILLVVRHHLRSTEVRVFAQGLLDLSCIISTNNGCTEGESQDSSDKVDESIGGGKAAVFAALNEESKDRKNQSQNGTGDANETKCGVRTNGPCGTVLANFRFEGSSSYGQIPIDTKNNGKDK